MTIQARLLDPVKDVPRPPSSIGRQLASEALGTALLVAIIIGSGMMGDRLAGDNVAIALLANTAATGAGLVVLITVLAPISGAHFNPAVTLALVLRREIAARIAAAYVCAQLAGAILGTWTAHAMFGEPTLQFSGQLREGPGQIFSETVATFGLVLMLLGANRFRPTATPIVVGLYICAAYWFTASTSFANPAVTVARAFSDTFAGIAPSSVPGFLTGQLSGAILAVALGEWLFKQDRTP
ncbi:MAG TPA: MIP/aquaporin family protein [Hyphomonas sp.]|uniref:Aquaporin/glycerol uptake facilitator protein n=1 Tax=Hyphomonas polymorpha PS728 TaxID=1280954 RepID=A0A062VIT9_9PROT|nr:MIP/aquaporin family protein [Hyphomonas polymorpha]KCZ97991.1 aquaporin/glycerol uptake facilitator protein [Hyphomonas polymorpha PS728]HRI99511.1 MIP/aquaporin family protein [Hyphomonas sp.]HRK65909.1 MIP/aquaporin family protein [Hyphomonas sp.]